MSQITISTITTIVRYLLNETAKSQVPGDNFTYSSSAIFTLTESNPIAISDVFVNEDTSGVVYSFDSDTNKVTITSSLTSGDTVEIQYTYYPNYSDTEIENYIRYALVHLSICGYYTFEVGSDNAIYPEPEDNEKNLIAFITATLISPNNITYRLPDMTLQVPNSMPTEDLIRKAVAIFKKGGFHGIFVIAGDEIT